MGSPRSWMSSICARMSGGGSPAAMRRQHAHERDAGRADQSARNPRLERKGATLPTTSPSSNAAWMRSAGMIGPNRAVNSLSGSRREVVHDQAHHFGDSSGRAGRISMLKRFAPAAHSGHEPPVRVLSGEADADDAAGLHGGDDALAERPRDGRRLRSRGRGCRLGAGFAPPARRAGLGRGLAARGGSPPAAARRGSGTEGCSCATRTATGLPRASASGVPLPASSPRRPGAGSSSSEFSSSERECGRFPPPSRS